jgi:hypothetical protein
MTRILQGDRDGFGGVSEPCVAGEARDRARRPVRVCRGTHRDSPAPGIRRGISQGGPTHDQRDANGLEPGVADEAGLRYALSIACHRPVRATTCRSLLSAPRRGLLSSALAERVELGVHRSNFELRGPWWQSQVRMPERRGILIATRPAICLSAMQRDPRVMNRPAMRQRGN